MYFDLPLDQLQTYLPPRQEPPDFDAFWAGTLAEARAHPLAATFAPVDSGLRLMDAFDVTFNGYDGRPVRGWLILPRERPGPLPCVVEYIGYGGGRGLSHTHLLWASAGYAHFVMDTRGQGSAWGGGGGSLVPAEQDTTPAAAASAATVQASLLTRVFRPRGTPRPMRRPPAARRSNSVAARSECARRSRHRRHGRRD